MNQRQAKKRALEIIKATEVFVFSTVDSQNRPQSRLMGAKLVERGLVIYMETYADSAKIKQIEKNPKVQLLFPTIGYSEVVTVSGKASLDASVAIRKKMWKENPASKDYFSSYNDPRLAIIKFQPNQIAYIGPETGTEVVVVKL